MLSRYDCMTINSNCNDYSLSGFFSKKMCVSKTQDGWKLQRDIVFTAAESKLRDPLQLIWALLEGAGRLVASACQGLMDPSLQGQVWNGVDFLTIWNTCKCHNLMGESLQKTLGRREAPPVTNCRTAAGPLCRSRVGWNWSPLDPEADGTMDGTHGCTTGQPGRAVQLLHMVHDTSARGQRRISECLRKKIGPKTGNGSPLLPLPFEFGFPVFHF
jgi:hypothetical protein